MDHTNPETLSALYWEQDLSLGEIASRAGVAKSVIHYHMEKHDIKRRTPYTERPPHFRTDADGYEELKHLFEGTLHRVLVHRLAAVAWFGFDAVAGNDVHHRNSVPWDNREANLEPLSRSEHGVVHVEHSTRDNAGRFAEGI